MKYLAPLNNDGTNKYYDSDPVNKISGSIVPAAVIEAVQKEIENAILSAGLKPNKDDYTQLAQAIAHNTNLIFDKRWVVATANDFGVVKPNNTTVTVKDGILNVAIASTKNVGLVQPDGRYITVSNTGTITVDKEELLKSDDTPSNYSNNFNNLNNSGMYFVKSTKGVTQNAPQNVTANWWLSVSVHFEGTTKYILQEARMHSNSSESSIGNGAANILSRCAVGNNWGGWQYNYAQYAG